MKKTTIQLVYELVKSGLSPEKVVNYLLIDEELMLEKEKEQMCDFVEYCGIEYSKYQETEASWIKELTIDDLFEKRHTNKQ
jgi:hypothetical protein